MSIFPFGAAAGILYGAVVVLLLAYLLLRGPACPACKRRWAMDTTGKASERRHFLFWQWQQEWRCKHCGYSEWRDFNPGGPD